MKTDDTLEMGLSYELEPAKVASNCLGLFYGFVLNQKRLLKLCA